MEEIHNTIADGELHELRVGWNFAIVKQNFSFMFQIQFGLMALHWISLLISTPIGYECGYPKMICGFMIPQNLFIFFLFFDFYLKTYRKKPEVVTAKSTISSDVNANVIKGDTKIE